MPINAHIYIYLWIYIKTFTVIVVWHRVSLKTDWKAMQESMNTWQLMKTVATSINSVGKMTLNRATPSKINEWLKRTMKIKIIKISIKSIQKSMNIVEKLMKTR